MASVVSDSEDIEITFAENKSTEVTTAESAETTPANKKRL
ncbi:21810_t:CDS:2 [Cetraspora pellucida]|uniref:21810_t:CDS:1 n=1 Tax=Cetraspora pellucida TaxID=1433469 RepID=A0A9N9GAH8_9GLOM|nr:21810_t:CDS:2 [Cetraspora pellucida]